MHYGISSDLPPEKVMDKAAEYFGKLGLKVTDRQKDTLCMEGGGGYVTLTVCGGQETDVDVITQEWNDQVKQFLQRIG